jgi:hypothetical protein
LILPFRPGAHSKAIVQVVFLPLIALVAVSCRSCSEPDSSPDDTAPGAAEAGTGRSPPVVGPWMIGLGGEGEDQGMAVATDSSGDVVVAGHFSGEVQLDRDRGRLLSKGGSDAFVASWTSGGEPRWSLAIGGVGEDRALAAVLDREGATVVTGRFQGTINLDAGQGEPIDLVSPGASAALVVRLDPEGHPLWARALGGAGWAEGQALALGDDGEVLVGGRFAGEVDFDPGEATALRSAASDVDAFVLRLSRQGDLEWVRTFGGAGLDEVQAIDALEGGSVVAGHFSDEVDLDPGEGETIRRSLGFTDVFVISLDGAGELRWVRTFGGELLDQAYGVAAGPTGESFVTGIFVGAVDFGSEGGGGVRESAGRSDIFLAKLDRGGVITWVRTLGGPSSDYAYGLALAPEGSVVATGRFGGRVDFDPGEGVRDLVSTGDEARPEGFLLRLDGEGRHLWSERFGGPGLDRGRAVAFSLQGAVIVTGSFEERASFPAADGEASLEGSAVGGSDALVIELPLRPATDHGNVR